MSDLKELRSKIDVIDAQIVELFKKRLTLCTALGAYKRKVGMPVIDKQREREKISTLVAFADDDFAKHAVEELFKQIISISRKYQYKVLDSKGFKESQEFLQVDGLWSENIKVVYQGIPGAYSQEALLDYFGEYVDNYCVNTWKKAMEDIRDQKADYAVIPIENSTSGIVSDVYDLLTEFDNYIVRYVDIGINHALLGTNDSTVPDIKTVISHPQAILQSKEFIKEHGWSVVTSANTAMSAQEVAKMNDKTVAAIASVKNAEIYGLRVLTEHLNKSDVNTTRFIILSRKQICRKDANKILICFELDDEKGSLYGALSHIIYNDVNIAKIDSRPIPDKKWKYRFFVEMKGKVNDRGVVNALIGMKDETLNLKILGNY